MKCESLTDADLKAQLQIYTQDLLAYPVEAAIRAVRRWPESNRFWPAWSELRAEVESAAENLRSRTMLDGPKYPTGAQKAADCTCWVCRAERKRGAEA